MANNRSATYCALTLGALLASAATADDARQDPRARVNYMLHCQGCHMADGAGLTDEVPPMRDFVGHFLHSPEGREFVVRVPGVANAPLSDDELAGLLNWVLLTFSAAELPADFKPFAGDEVGPHRSRPLSDPNATREQILRDLGHVAGADQDD